MCNKNDFAHLHVHTQYSLLDGLSRVEDLVSHVKSIGQDAIAITDHGAMLGMVGFYDECLKEGIKPIIGMEGYLTAKGRRMSDKDKKLDRQSFHMLLLAINGAGYRNLSLLSSLGQTQGFYYRPRIDRETMAEYADGIVATSGCLAAEIPGAIMAGDFDEAKRLIGWYQDVFGKDNFFLELQYRLNSEDQHLVNKELIRLSKSIGVPLVATTDAHYVQRGDAKLHDTLLCMQTGARKSQTERMRFDEDTYYVTDTQTMFDFFDEVPDAIYNTRSIAERADVTIERDKYHLPRFDVGDEYEDELDFLRYLVSVGLEWRYPNDDGSARSRLEHELSIIEEMGFETYFLVVWDLCEWARRLGIWWNVRGSGAGSVVNYCLGITSIDPLEHGLYFERFLNPDRVTMPDIDLDFEDARREKLVQYLAARYGKDKVAGIITFGRAAAKGAIRDVARVYDVPLQQVGVWSREIGQSGADTIEDAMEISPILQNDYGDPLYKQVFDEAISLQGIVRQTGSHAAGYLVTPTPITDFIPTYRFKSSETLGALTQLDMNDCEHLGLLKIDMLGLSTLSVMRNACTLINDRHGVWWDIETIPFRHTGDAIDEQLDAAFELISAGDTDGVFQIEGHGMTSMLKQMKPTKYEHIVAAISLFRPGPLQYIDLYISRMHGREPVEYRHPKLEPILANTYGVCVAGDTEVYDINSGKHMRIDQIEDRINDISVQSIDDDGNYVACNITKWHHNGKKRVYLLQLANGREIKATADHKFLTEDGWIELKDIKSKDYIATPNMLIEPNNDKRFDRSKLRVLAYLIGDGDLSSGSSVGFINKNPLMLLEYIRCASVFEDVIFSYVKQIRDVFRINIKNRYGKRATSLLLWLRELGLKYSANQRPLGGVRSAHKYVPEFVFNLSNADIAWFIASLWDCDGYVDNKVCHYKTTSRQLAHDVSSLLLRLGINSTIYTSEYTDSNNARKIAYQISTFDTQLFSNAVGILMASAKGAIHCTGASNTSINRLNFIQEVKAKTNQSARELMQIYDIDRQHFYASALKNRPRIKSGVVQNIASKLNLPQTLKNIKINWQEVVDVKFVGMQDVYDLTIDRHHNFVANNIIVHNCIYQEQIIQIASQLFGYRPGEADLIRKAVGKKLQDKLEQHKKLFLERGPQNGIDEESSRQIWEDIEHFANYGFNLAHASDYAKIAVQTAFLKAHYPIEYMTALMRAYSSATEKIAHIIDNCRTKGIDVLMPNINKSGHNFSIETRDDGTEAIRCGLEQVKYVGWEPVEEIIKARQQHGPFETIGDLISRTNFSSINKRAIESMARVGALDDLLEGTPWSRYDLWSSITKLKKYARALAKRGKEQFVATLFDDGDDEDLFEIDLNDFAEYDDEEDRPTEKQLLKIEADMLGYYINRPIERYLDRLKDIRSTAVEKIINSDVEGGVIVCGEIISRRVITDRRDRLMCFAEIEGWRTPAKLTLVVFADQYIKYGDLLREGNIVKVEGRTDNSHRGINILVNNVELIGD